MLKFKQFESKIARLGIGKYDFTLNYKTINMIGSHNNSYSASYILNLNNKTYYLYLVTNNITNHSIDVYINTDKAILKSLSGKELHDKLNIIDFDWYGEYEYSKNYTISNYINNERFAKYHPSIDENIIQKILVDFIQNKPVSESKIARLGSAKPSSWCDLNLKDSTFANYFSFSYVIYIGNVEYYIFICNETAFIILDEISYNTRWDLHHKLNHSDNYIKSTIDPDEWYNIFKINDINIDKQTLIDLYNNYKSLNVPNNINESKIARLGKVDNQNWKFNYQTKGENGYTGGCSYIINDIYYLFISNTTAYLFEEDNNIAKYRLKGPNKLHQFLDTYEPARRYIYIPDITDLDEIKEIIEDYNLALNFDDYKGAVQDYLSIKESKIARLAGSTNNFTLIWVDEDDKNNQLWVYNNIIYLFITDHNVYIFKNEINYNNKEELIEMLNDVEDPTYFYIDDLTLEENLYDYYNRINPFFYIVAFHNNDHISELSGIPLDEINDFKIKINEYLK